MIILLSCVRASASLCPRIMKKRECAYCLVAESQHLHTPLNQCTRCKGVLYCSPTCQKAHWREHKPNCRTSTLALIVHVAQPEGSSVTVHVPPIPASAAIFAAAHDSIPPRYKCCQRCGATERLVHYQACLATDDGTALVLVAFACEGVKVCLAGATAILLHFKNLKKQIIPHALSMCSVCRHTGKTFRCERCLSVSYCSEACQKSHWEAHKSFCVAPAPDTDQGVL